MAYNHKVDGSVVKWIDIFLLGILGLFALAFLPQMLNMLRSRSEWWRGLILYGTQTATRDDSSSITARNSRDQPSVAELKGSGRGMFHVKSLSTRFFPIAKILRLPLPFPCYTVGKGFLVLFYFGTLLFAALYRDSVFKNPTREGALVASQLPWVYILGTKNNAIGVLTGRGFEKLNYLHRNAGKLTVLAANVHAIGFIYKWVINGTWTKDIQEPWIRWGLVALVAMDILFIFSLTFIRRNYYNVFYVSHSIALVVLLFAICLHQPFAIPYVAIASGFYGVDHILRLVKSRVPSATLEAVPDLQTTLVRVPSLNAGWRAGQFVRVRVLSRGMGWFGWSEAHAFTIASVCECASGDGMLLMVKRCGSWTRKLYALASAQRETKDRPRVRLLVEGPYGGPGFMNFSSFSGALFICGGSGITFGISAVQEILQRVSQGASNVRTIELVWCATHARALTPLLNCFTSMLVQSYSLPVELTIQVFYTRALSKDDTEKYPSLDTLPRGLALSSGRAFVPQLLDGFVERTQAVLSQGGRAQAHGVLLGVCGPAGLAKDARAAIAGLDGEDRRGVGGVEFHDEAFHW